MGSRRTVTDFPDDYVSLGRICGVYGVRGWLKIHSYTEPRENVVRYSPWTLAVGGRLSEVEVEQGRAHGKGVVAKLAGLDDRDAALELVGAELAVPRSALPALPDREYYWADLEGLEVVDAGGRRLGRVERLIETGAHDVLVLDGGDDRLIPFALGEVVRDVDLAGGRIVVDWQAEWWNE